MNDDLDKKLCEKYPKIFVNRNADMRETAMCWGFSCEDGWFRLIDQLCQSLQWNTDKNKYPQVIADQVKEKFGELRFYYHTSYDDKDAESEKNNTYFNCGVIDGMIDFASKMSRMICECCGKSKEPEIKMLNSGWYKSFCNKCHDKRNKREIV